MAKGSVLALRLRAFNLVSQWFCIEATIAQIGGELVGEAVHGVNRARTGGAGVLN